MSRCADRIGRSAAAQSLIRSKTPRSTLARARWCGNPDSGNKTSCAQVELDRGREESTDRGMVERDIWLTAHLMVKRFGADAELEASIRADQLLAAGDLDGKHAWLRIRAAIAELTAGPADGDLLN